MDSKARRMGIVSMLVLAVATVASAQGGPPPGKGGGGGGGGGEETTANNLSYPVVFTGAAIALNGSMDTYTLVGDLGAGFSYGCDRPQVIGTTTYPNFSCVSETGVALGYDECATSLDYCAPTAGCAGGTCVVERIYWQKRSSLWQAGNVTGAGATPVHFGDWGDNLESQTWTSSSVIRVEFTPFNTLTASLRGYQMWHVSGQGVTELWGVRATDGGLAYAYAGTHATVHTAAAQLILSKLETGVGSLANPPDPAGFTWSGDGWAEAVQNTVILPGAELNIGGKVMYGYNWNLKTFTMVGGVLKAGWWRLTFSPGGALAFLPECCAVPADGCPAADACTTLTAPPAAPAAVPLELEVAAAAEEGDTGPLYVPAVDPVHNLTYIDVFIQASKGGGRR